jgi:2'-5' RNA ligase
MRIFIASEVTGIIDELQHVQSRLRTLPAKQTFPTTFHITYQFIGDVPLESVDKLKEKLAHLRFDKLTCKVTRLQWFPEQGDIRVVWAQVKPIEPLQQLQKKILAVIDRTPDKEFIPHITLSRVKKFENKREFKDGLQAIKCPLLTFDIREIKLIQSELTSRGATYTDLRVIYAQNHQNL